ncbi:uncharacterized protein BT62DRAFT_926732 [Guyanagaster necrorhizus]|uniref:Uncharacterized protein n=1 Tax=Guyanagaster necrorhizus TaxID=856835 RepID=A0A9P8AWZ4_9AGAR|nr:uncharacterized protein BT62DRAFT_926732 [Guyanagaster necrorhizus MCA 3950]KAG7451083.1 hypothetical protein BT62DRAFT_926732 [Guyanagaster necrorhizus MCA 3950]
MSTSIAFTPSFTSSSCNKRLFSSSGITTATHQDEPPYKKQCRKTPMSGLRRTHSFLSLTDLPQQQQDQQQSPYLPQSRGRCCERKMSISPAGRDFRACLETSIASSLAPISHPYSGIQQSQSSSPESIPSSSYYTSAPRVSSPLRPSRPPSFIFTSSTTPPRKGKCEPDLHRIAIQACMRSTSDGLKVLTMGPRLAMSIVHATRELERMVTERGLEIFDNRQEEDIIMTDSTAEPWINMERTSDDWEMVNCDL